MKRLTQLTQSAPTQQPKRRKPTQPQQTPPPPPPIPQAVSPQAVWAEVAAIPGISPIVQEWASGA